MARDNQFVSFLFLKGGKERRVFLYQKNTSSVALCLRVRKEEKKKGRKESKRGHWKNEEGRVQ